MKVGFVGLGAMGWPMAVNLNRSQLLTCVHNRSHEKAMAFTVEQPCPAHEDLGQFSPCDVVVTCVSADEDVLGVIKALSKILAPDSIVVDCSTTRADTAQQAAEILQQRQIHFLDAPVSGGTEGAKNGTLAIMVGGDPEIFDRLGPVFQCLGKKVVHMGPVGSGQSTKAANQIGCAGVNQAVSEALAFAQAHKLPLEKVIDVMSAGAAGSWHLVNRGPNMIKDAYPLGFKVALHAKDLSICQSMAAEFDVRLPMVEMTLIHYQRLLKQGDADKDISSLFQLKRDLFDKTQP